MALPVPIGSIVSERLDIKSDKSDIFAGSVMGSSFQEKSLWLMLVSLAVVFGAYFRLALPLRTPDVNPANVGLFVAAVVVLVIAQIAGHLIVALFDRDDRTDERDRLIALKGTRNGGYVLATGVFLALCTAVATTGNFVTAHVLLASWVLAQMVEIATQLWHYRRGA